MKQTLLFFCFSLFFILSYFGRYQPVSLDLVSPTVKEVEVKGEVKQPGVYTLKWEGTVQDAIEAAGGYTPNAQSESVSLTAPVQDKDVIVIAKKEEGKEKISINSASIDQLQTLPGIGPALAARIVEYRKETSFRSLEQIKEVKGIGDKMFEKIKDEIIL